MDTDSALDLHLRLRSGNRKPNRLMGKSRAASGVINLTDAGYRRAYIDAYYRTVGGPYTRVQDGSISDVERRLDSWQVLEVEVDGETRWCPHPLWDILHGYLVRPTFASEEEALLEIDRVGGVRAE